MRYIMPFLFFGSGATALVYEVVWSKYLSLMFGSTIQAQTVVLAVFMGGLALGNLLFGRRADAMAQPVKTYGYIEIAIGVYALLFNALYGLGDRLFIATGTGFLESSGILLVLKGSISLALLLGPTVLMGGTLPLVAAWLQRSSGDAGRSSARFYAINTLGAVAGAGLAGFFLVRHLGILSTLWVTGAANILIGVAAIGVARRQQLEPAKPAKKSGEEMKGPETSMFESKWLPFNRLTLACGVVFFTGGISMGLEILAARSLSLIFGSSLQAFSVVLMAFILGIGLGSFAIASIRKKQWLGEGTTVVLLLATSLLIAAFILTIEQWALFYLKLRNSYAGHNRYLYHQMLTVGISLVVLGIPAALLGAVLPLWIRIVSASSETLGRHVGRLLTWNTLGAVAGVLFTGFILMPTAGLRLSFGFIGILSCVAALLIALRNNLANHAIVCGFAIAALGVTSVSKREDWQYLLSSGIFRMREAEVPKSLLWEQKKQDKILFYEDAADATVSVVTDLNPSENTEIVLSINGKQDASSRGDLSTQYLLAHLPMMMRPDAKDVFVLGFGSGITAGALLGHPVESITIAENCNPVLKAATFFSDWNRGVWTNSLARVVREDGRTVLKLSPKKYDIIISEPSNPWLAGVGSVFSREFYELAASRLKDGGIMTQWFHTYEMSDEIVALVLRTFQSVFPFMEVWESQMGDILILGSRQHWEPTPELFAKVFERTQPKADLLRIGLLSPEAVFVRQLASKATSFAIAPPGPWQSDLRPILEYEAPKAFYEGRAAFSLFIFDERTFQARFAPESKRKMMVSLPDEHFREAFASYGTANTPLMQYVEYRSLIKGLSREYDVFRPAPFFDLIFRRADTYPKVASYPEDAGFLQMQLLDAEATIQGNPDRWLEGVEVIEKLFQNYTLALQTETFRPTPVHFAALAAKARYAHGDPAGALKTVELGLKVSPTDIQLLYMKRLLEGSPPKGQI